MAVPTLMSRSAASLRAAAYDFVVKSDRDPHIVYAITCGDAAQWPFYGGRLLALGAPVQLSALEHLRLDGGAAHIAGVGGAAVDVDLTAVIILTGWAVHRLGCVPVSYTHLTLPTKA